MGQRLIQIGGDNNFSNRPRPGQNRNSDGYDANRLTIFGITADWSPQLLGEKFSASEEISRLLPEAHVIKAFNTIFADVMGGPLKEKQAITAFIAGDNNKAKAKVISLAKDIGYAPVDTGPLYTACYLESMAHLNIQIALGQGGGTNAAFVYLQEKSA